MHQPFSEGNLYCPNTETLAEALTEHGNTSWSVHYHRDRNEQETRNATLARPSYRLAIRDKSGAKPVPSAGPYGTVPCPLKYKP